MGGGGGVLQTPVYGPVCSCVSLFGHHGVQLFQAGASVNI